ncbi:endonuclease/exonuclease/phosphatase family protein [Candidatus Sumerlaeota bacterium]|nr:endonuclease/exonuclease/phosphatase family protein [Candidatus Sumerlaeota bacterium]
MNKNRIRILIIPISALIILSACHKPLKSSSGLPEQPLTIITYNVLYGFNHQNNMKEGAEWIKNMNPDVLALQELNDFNEQKLSELARQWNHNYAVILKEDGFPVGLTSKTPIEVIAKRLDGFHHGYLHGKTAGIDFLVIHLSPHDYLFRQKEADMLSEKIQKLLAEKRHVVALGDFNSFSASDKSRTDAKTELLERQKKGKNLNNGKFDYSVMKRFKDAGLIDICDKMLPDTDADRFSFPTKIVDYAENEEDQKKFARRIDYIWMDANLAKNATQAFVPRDEVLNSISDHFPVIVTLKGSR